MVETVFWKLEVFFPFFPKLGKITQIVFLQGGNGSMGKINQKGLGCGTESQHTRASHLPSRSPIQPTVKEETMPPMANTDTDRDQYMVRMCGEVARSSLMSVRGGTVPSVPPWRNVPSSPEALVAYLSGGTMPSTRP